MVSKFQRHTRHFGISTRGTACNAFETANITQPVRRCDFGGDGGSLESSHSDRSEKLGESNSRFVKQAANSSLCIVLNLLQVIFATEALRVNLVNIFRSR